MAKNTIKIKKYLDVIAERAAAEAITPGMLIELNSSDKFQKHSHVGGPVVPPIFALENELEGEGITDNYAADDRVQGWVANRGDQVYALLADGQTAVIGSKLASNGDGYLKVHGTSSVAAEEAIVGIALEAVDRSSSSGADTNVTGRIEIMVC